MYNIFEGLFIYLWIRFGNQGQMVSDDSGLLLWKVCEDIGRVNYFEMEWGGLCYKERLKG